jgi:predicted DCC family thiol-disulfide oxidoreductase YuxK
MHVAGASAWTGGQYSLYRVFLGLYLTIHFALLRPYGAEVFSNEGVLPDATVSPLIRAFPNILAIWDDPTAVSVMLTVGVVAAITFTVGWADRLSALILWYILACLVGRNPLIGNPSLPFVGWLLLAHLFLPRQPYGSVSAIGRTDPGGGWRMPWPIWAAAWVVMALGYSYSGYTKLVSPSWIDGTAFTHLLDNPLARDNSLRMWLLDLPPIYHRVLTWTALGVELFFVVLALFRRTRGWAWLAMVLMHLSLLCLLNFADLTTGMLVLHAFTFDPSWLSRPLHEHPRVVFYDGTCGLCHRAIRLLIAEDPDGRRFRFAPLQGTTFAERVPEEVRSQLPDSLVVVNPDSKLRVKGEAVQVLLADLGGLWRLPGWMLRPLPGRVQDALYDLVAGNRTRFFGQTEEACPLLPPELRERFLP